jgi:hypothetical protein
LLAPQDRGALAYVILDGGTLVRPDGTIDAAGLDWEALGKAIRPPKGRKDPVVVFNPIYHDPFPADNTREVVRWCLEGFGRDLGFAKARQTYTMNGGYKWDETRTAIAKKMGGRPDAAEPMTGNSAVEVYPVRTVLSRHLTGNADCVVRIVAPFQGPSADKLEPEVDKAIRTYVNNLGLEEKDKLEFRLGFKESAREAADRFYDTTAGKLAQELGFKERLVNHWYEP